MRRPLTVLISVVLLAIVAVGCSVDSPKLAPGPTVTTGPEVPTTEAPTTVAGVGPASSAAAPKSSIPAVVAPAGCPRSESPEGATPTQVATAVGGLRSLDVHPTAAPGEPCLTLPNPDAEFQRPQVFVALRRQGDWTEVELPSRPNGSLGWVRSADVAMAQHSYRIDISVSGRRVRVYNGAEKLIDSPAAVGTGDTPTPPGTYYTVALIKPTNHGYGPYAYALSGHSDALFSFAGGDGRIGLHGTDDPGSIGNSVSHGCIRVANDVITRMAEQIRLPLGVPVVISA